MEICTEPVSLDGYCLCLIFMRNPNGLWDFHNILRDQHLGTKVKPSASKMILKGRISQKDFISIETLKLRQASSHFASNLSLPCILIEFGMLSVY